MHTLQAAVVGAIQGLSEFLPISSSAHITFANEFFNLFSPDFLDCACSAQGGCSVAKYTAALLAKDEEIFLDIMVHLATLFAIIIYFFKDLKTIFSNYFISFKKKEYQNENFKILNYIILSTLTTGAVGLCVKGLVEKVMDIPEIICILLFITGVVLILCEFMYKGNQKIGLKTALLMGLAQGLAIFPGFSRSGFTIASAIFCGVSRTEAARFSFLMSIPVIFLASLVYPLFELDLSEIAEFNLKAILIGSIVSFIVGYLCIKYFMQMLKKMTLKFFGYYCFSVSVLMFVLFLIFRQA